MLLLVKHRLFDLIFLYFLIGVFALVNAKQVRAKDIAPYVFPNNLTATPGNFEFMPDGLSYLRLSENKKMIVQYDTENGFILQYDKNS